MLVTDAMVSLKSFEDKVKYQFLFGLVLIVFWHFRIIVASSFIYFHSGMVPGTICALFFLGWLFKGIFWRCLHILVLSSILLGTSSATFVSLLIGIAGSVLVLRIKTLVPALYVISITIVLIVWTEFNGGGVLFGGKRAGSIHSASGRIPTWELILKNRVEKKPLLGYGFGQGESLSRVFDFHQDTVRMTHMHNTFMSALANLGIIGFGLFVLFLFDIFRLILKSRDHPHRPIMIGAATAIIFNSLSTPSIASTLSLYWIGHTLFFIMIATSSVSSQRMEE
jgi:O-antigen ligase